MLKNEHIRAHVTSNDKTLIAELVGCTRQFVYLVLTDQRNQETEQGRQIIELAIALVSSRKAIKDLFKEAGSEFTPSWKKYLIPIEAE